MKHCVGLKKKLCCGYTVTLIRLLDPISRISPTIPFFLFARLREPNTFTGLKILLPIT